MKKLVAVFCVFCMALVALCGCRSQVAAKSFGGHATITLEPNQKLEMITWRNSSLWCLTRPMTDDDVLETHTFQQYSEFGILEGTVTIIETRGMEEVE